MKWGLWSTTAGSNSATPPDGWPEGQAPSTVNDCAREMMAQIRVGLNDLAQGFIDLGQSPTYVSGTTFTTPTNDTSYMPVGGRLRFNVGSNVLYGTVVSVSYSTNTFVSVTMDSGALTASLSSMAVGVFARGSANHIDGAVTISSTAVAGMLTLTNTHTNSGMWLRCSAGAKLVQVNNSSNFLINNSANSTSILTLTDAGALTVTGNVTAFSDERLKKDWRPLPLGIIEKVAAITKSGSFERIDMEGRFYGAGAQSFMEILPYSGKQMEDGTWAMDYGGTALALVVELCREIGYLRGRVRKLERS